MTTPHVVLLAEDGSPVGTAPKAEVHHTDTPLHLAFSCYLLDDERRVLLTRRALAKRTFAGVWTNSCCGHPMPGEEIPDAVRRHLRDELGVEARDVQPLLPDFRYRATDASGIVENEVCPVFTAVATSAPTPDPAEVMDLRWVPAGDLDGVAAAASWALSPWMVEQVAAMRAAGVGLPTRVGAHP